MNALTSVFLKFYQSLRFMGGCGTGHDQMKRRVTCVWCVLCFSKECQGSKRSIFQKRFQSSWFGGKVEVLDMTG